MKGAFRRFITHLNNIRGSSGASLIEFALVAPVFLMLLIGSIEFARLFIIENALIAGVRQAGRYGITGANAVGQNRSNSVTQVLKDTIKTYSAGLVDPSKLQISSNVYQSLNQIQPLTMGNDPQTLNPGGSSEVIQYMVIYPTKTLIPFLSNNGVLNLTAEATYVNENYGGQ